ncbi:Type I Iterative PKS [Diaporthe australafricana]|uniref:Type I Iterative PKS n=1 Tax=Diaporthe australafricana TaxID=127596 RepID=A0ABR3WPC2_9PEZI
MSTQEQHEAVAIVGMGCRWPGGVRNGPEFWEFLKNRVDGWREFDDPRFSAQGFHHPNTDRPGTMAMRGAFLADEDARLFDHSFFGMTGLEVETLDPSQRKLLEVTYEAFENGGETWESVSGTRTGVFVGNFCLDHWMIQSRDWDFPRPYAFTGAGTSILANRISYIFNLSGPSLTVDTACSSSMYALHLAMNAIRAGDCDAAVVASANWIADPGVQIALDKLGALSASARCHTFDIRAEGYARGEGYGAIYLKRASSAVADGSPIRALIRGSSMNSNGKTGGITRPSPAGQEAVIREAYRNAGHLSFSDTSYFECHGTGTYVGDPLEVAAVGRVFAGERAADDPLLVGSVKTNVGHTEGASALASIMKVVLSLEHGVIPPIFDLQTLNPNVDFEGASVKVVQDMTEFPDDKLKRASINSFGYGGANGHCIIDHVQTLFPDYVKPGVYGKQVTNGLTNGISNGKQNGSQNGHQNGHLNGHLNGLHNGYQNGGHQNGHSNGHSNGYQNGSSSPKHHPITSTRSSKAKRAADAGTRPLVLLPFAAHNKDSLQLNIAALGGAIDRFALSDVAYTLGTRRSRLPHRTFRVVAADKAAAGLLGLDGSAAAITPPVLRSPLQPGGVGFVFTGQGAQWPAMGAELLSEYGVFRAAIRYLDHVLSTLPAPPKWTLAGVLSGEAADPELIHAAEVSQTACTALQVGLVDLLASWSVRPVAVAGHSSGEIGAAYASGRVTAAEAIVAAYFRGQAVARNQQKGAMLAVGLGPEDTYSYLAGREDKVRIAAYNSPGSVTLSGDADAVEELAKQLDGAGIFNRLLKTGGNAYHSHHMLALGRDYDALLSEGLAHIQKLGLANGSSDQRYDAVRWVSSVTPGKTIPPIMDMDVAGPAYWRANLESPVRFSDAIAGLVDSDDVQVLVEVGPHPALKSPIDQILKKADKSSVAYRSTLKRQKNGRESMLELAGGLFCLNADIDLASVNAVDGAHGGLEHGSIAVDLPPYQYAYGPVAYHESRQSKEYRHRKVKRHDLLGSKVAGNAKLRPQWRNLLRVKDVPWLADHRLLPDAVFPAAGYVALAVEAARRIHEEFPTQVPIAGYSLRDVSIKSSLPIPEDDFGVEIMTSMEVVDVSTSQSPAWASFSVSSVTRESEEWTEHCTGLVMIQLSEPDPSALTSTSGLSVDSSTTNTTGGRAVNADNWYKKFAAIGLGYGKTFQPLSDIHTDPQSSSTNDRALATVSLKTTAGSIQDESRYALHPASLDGAIQLGLIACHGGQADQATTAFVPVHLSQLYLSNTAVPSSLESATAVARGQRRGLRGAYLDLAMTTPDGRQVLRVEGLRCTSYSRAAPSSSSLGKAHSSPFSRLVWKPDIRALSSSQCGALFPPPPENVDRAPLWAVVNTLAQAIVYSIYETFAGDGAAGPEPQPAGEVGHFFEWIKRRGTLDDNQLRREFRRMTGAQRQARLEGLVAQAPHVIEVQTAKLLHDNMADILAGRRTGVDVFISKGLLTPLYEEGLLMTGVYPQLFKVMDILGHANPNMRYFEIGGGTGGATRVAMRALRGPNGIKSYKDYTFTDISPGFLGTAREALSGSGFEDMIYSVLDAEQDPEASGYEPVYDVVIACQVLHATSDMKKTLTNVGKLLKPGGKLVLVETNQNFIVPGVVVGTFTGYWAGIPDGRVDAPFMSLDKWDENLQAVGFSGTELVLDDFPSPHNTTSVIVSTFTGSPLVPEAIKSTTTPGELQLLHSSSRPAPSLLGHLKGELEGRGLSLVSRPFHGVTSSAASGPQHAVLFLDDERLELDSEEDLAAIQHLARNSHSLTILTSCGIAKGRNPDGHLIPGLLRVLRTENPTSQFLSIDIDGERFEISGSGDAAEETRHLTRAIADQILELRSDVVNAADNAAGEESPTDREFVWQDGCLWVSRIVPVSDAETPVAGEYYSPDGKGGEIKTELLPLNSHDAVYAAFETSGVLASLYFAPNKETLTPLPEDAIDVKVTAIGINRNDLDVWSGRVDALRSVGEYTGVVTATGASVKGLGVGNRVLGLSTGQIQVGNWARVPSALALKLQPNDDPKQLVTLPRAYATAIYALEHVAHLSPGASWTGKTVLVQSATTQVGQALLALSKAKGADVYAVVSSAEVASFLAKKTGLSSSSIFASQDPATGLRRAAAATQKGVNGSFDIILSTERTDLDFLFMTPRLLRPLGQLIHAGRIEGQKAQAAGGLDMGLLSEKNATFSVVDLAVALDSNARLGGQLLQTVDKYYRRGLIKPSGPFSDQVTDVADLSRVLTEFSKSEVDTGKLVVTFEKPEAQVKMVPPFPSAKFDSEAWYVITGALGGLGQSIVRWMVDHGARHLLLLSRRAIDRVPDAQRLVTDLANHGVEARPVACDITDLAQVRNALSYLASSSHHPIRGVVHAAVSWQDLSFDKLTLARWRESLAAKVRGTKNLHEATLAQPLDFFVMTTSLLSVYALATQAAYTAANNFQDGFARHRRARGLPASTVAFSLIRDVGATGSEQATVDTFERNRTLTLSEQQFLALLEPAFLPRASAGAAQGADPLSAANLITCLDPAAMVAKNKTRDGGAPAGSAPRWYGDGRVAPITRAFTDAQQHAQDQLSGDAGVDGSGAKSRTAQLQQELEAGIQGGAGQRAATVALVENAIAETVAEMLFIDREAVDSAKSVADYGVDSLIAAELRTWFVEALKTDISMLKLLDQSVSIGALAAKIVDDALA